ncbi:MAG: tRNA(fMet)-specific endonuclease VapC [Patescibacteria group bacterium]|nr:tRNA(fMet)-specific endonuclease VapC [Patescibacteria group bacterium]
MIKVALDTNVVTAILRGKDDSIEPSISKIDIYYIPFTVHAELLAGSKSGKFPLRYISALQIFLDKKYVEVSSVKGDELVEYYAEIYAYLKKQATPVSPNDIWIAAECAQQGLPLFTLDSDFERIPQILKF